MKASALLCLLLAALLLPEGLYSQENATDSTGDFGANRSVGFAVSARSVRDFLDIPELSIIVPMSERTEMQMIMAYSDAHVNTGLLIYGSGPYNIFFSSFFTSTAAVGVAAKLLHSTKAENGVSARLGFYAWTTFVVRNSKDPIETISRASFSSGILGIGFIGGAEYTLSSRVRLSAYFVPHYERAVKPGYPDELRSESYNQQITGFYMPLILEIAVKPF